MIQVRQQERTFFDALCEEVERANLGQYVTIKEDTVIMKILRDGKWRDNRPSPKISSAGDGSKLVEFNRLKQRLQLLGAEEGHEFAAEYTRFTFSLKLKVGSLFPRMEQIGKLGYQGTFQLQHTPGQVMLVVFWTTSIWQSGTTLKELEHIAENNSARWEGKVRIAAINASRSEEVAMNIAIQMRLRHFEHYFSGRAEDHDEIGMLSLDRYPDVLLIDKQGKIVKKSDNSRERDFMDWKDQIDRLINNEEVVNSEPIDEEEEKEDFTSNLGEQSWRKFAQIMDSLEDMGNNFLTLRIDRTRKRKYTNGKVEFNTSPLRIAYSVDAAQIKDAAAFVQKITNGLTPHQYIAIGQVDDVDMQIKLSYERAVATLDRYSFKAKPFLRRYDITPVQNQQQYREDMKADEIVVQIDAVSAQERNKLTQLYRELKGVTKGVAIEVKVAESYVGCKFDGLNKLQGDKGEEQSIQTSGAIQLIVFPYGKDSVSMDHIGHLIREMEKAKLDTVLHLVSKQRSPPEIDELKKLGKPNVKFYSTRLGWYERKLEAIGYNRNPRFTLIVDGQGTVLNCGEFINYQQLSQLVGGERTKFQTQYLAEIDKQHYFDTTKQIFEELQKLKDYKASVQLTITKDSDCLEPGKSCWQVPKLELTVRDTDRRQLDPLIRQFKKIRLVEDIIKTVQLPLGKECVECHCELKLPYYWYFTSNNYRCVACTSKQNPTQHEKLHRYPALENSVLIFDAGCRTVDVKRLGYNLQPQSESQCYRHRFNCDGCGRGPENDLRHICMGCKRQPNPRDFIDFCRSCVNSMLQGNRIEQIVERNKRTNHKKEHPLLQVIYQTIDYYTF